jgi:hypothetical protein
VTMSTCENHKVMFTVTLFSALREQSVASNDKRSQIGRASTLAGNTTSSCSSEAEEMSQCLGCCLLDDCESRWDLENMQLQSVSWVCREMNDGTYIGIENREDHIWYHTNLLLW